MFIYADTKAQQISAVSAIGELQEYKSDFSNRGCISCQIGPSRLFQIFGEFIDSFRIFKLNSARKCLTIEREGTVTESYFDICLANFED